MSSDFDPAHIPPSYFDERIDALSRHIESLTEEIASATEQREWWRKGRALFVQSELSGGEVVETVPPNDEAPRTHAHAVLRVLLSRPMTDRGEPVWAAAEVIEELQRRGWAPESEKHGGGIVRAVLRDLSKRGVLARPGHGLYALAPAVRSQGEEVLSSSNGHPRASSSIADGILEAVAELDRPKPAQIFVRLKERGQTRNLGSVQNVLSQLAKEGTVVRIGDGRYDLASRNGSSSEPHAGPSENGTSGPLFTAARSQEAANE